MHLTSDRGNLSELRMGQPVQYKAGRFLVGGLLTWELSLRVDFMLSKDTVLHIVSKGEEWRYL